MPPGEYGWVALSELVTKVTGEWTCDANGHDFTAPDRVTDCRASLLVANPPYVRHHHRTADRERSLAVLDPVLREDIDAAATSSVATPRRRR